MSYFFVKIISQNLCMLMVISSVTYKECLRFLGMFCCMRSATKAVWLYAELNLAHLHKYQMALIFYEH